MKTIFTFLIFVSLFLPVSSPAGEVRVDWEGAFDGQPGSVLRDPERRLDLAPTAQDNLRLVDKATEPPSPFAGGEAALLVDSTAEIPYWLRLCFRPFEGPEAQQGTVEFLLHPLEGKVVVQAGHQESFWDSEVRETYYIGTAAFDVGLNPGEEPTVGGRIGETDSIGIIVPGESYRVTIKWDFAQATPVVRIFLNGEVLRDPATGAPLDPAQLRTLDSNNGLNAFRITLGRPEDHLGRLFVGPMAAVLAAPDDMLQAGDPLLAR